MPPIRVGIVGAGRIVPSYLRGYAALRAAGFDDVRITAICSRDPARARSFVSGGGPSAAADFQHDVDARVFTDVREMLDAGVVDAVDVTTEVSLQHTQALACLEAGVHAMVQKPFAITVRAARRMVDTARQRGLALVVCENARFNRPVRIAKWLIDRGDLGTPQMASATSLGTMWSPDNWVGNSNWRHRKLIGAGGADADHLFPLGLSDAFALLLHDWLSAIRDGHTPETGGEEGLRDLAASFAIVEASAVGRAVTLDEVLSGAVDGYQRELDEHYSLLP